MHAKVIISALLLAASASAVEFKRSPEFEIQASKRDITDLFKGLGGGSGGSNSAGAGGEIGDLLKGLFAGPPSDGTSTTSSLAVQATPATGGNFDLGALIEQLVGGAAPKPAAAAAAGPPPPKIPPGSLPTPVVHKLATDASGSVIPTPPAGGAAAAPPPGVTPPPSKRGFLDNISSMINGLPTDLAGPAQSLFAEFQSGYSSGAAIASPTISSSTSVTPTPTAPPTSSSSSTNSATSTSSTSSGSSSPTSSSNAAVGNLSFSKGSMTGLAAVVGSVLLGSAIVF